MRYGVLSDIHGNLFALQEAISVLERDGVDSFLCVGDIVGYGPRPNECVELVAGLGAVCVAGNHELIALDRLPDTQCSPLARDTLLWTKRVLRDDAVEFLNGLPMVAEAPGGVIVTHASLHDPQEYVTRPRQAELQLDSLEAERPDAQLLILGHTHQPWAYSRRYGALGPAPDGSVRLGGRGRCLLNPGSTGQSYARHLRAQMRFMLLDMDEMRATFYDIPYDIARCREELRRAGLPLNALHRRRPILPHSFHNARSAVGQRVGQALRRLVAA